MTELKEKAINKSAELAVKAALIDYLSDFERYEDYENELTYCDMHADFDDTKDPVEFLRQSKYRTEDYFFGHAKYVYQYELLEKIIRAINAV